jgi:hypothetical protein
MKYSITESKLESTIYTYINDLFEDDLNHIYAEDDYGNEMESGIQFYFGDYGDDEVAFYWYDTDYFDGDCEWCPIAEFSSELENKLNSLFDDKWHTPFKKWLQKEYNLKVKTIK